MREGVEVDFFENLSDKWGICGKKLFDKWRKEAYNNIIEQLRYK